MILETAAILGLGMGALNYSEARKAQKKAEAHAKAVIAERRAAKKAALKAVRQSYRELDEDSSRALNQALKEGGVALYKSVGGTTGANFARGMFRQFGAAQRQARKEESRAIADIEGRTTLEMNDFAGLAAGAGALAEMRNDLIKQGLGALGMFAKGPQLENSPSPTGAGTPVQPVTTDTFGQNVGTGRTTPGPYASGYRFGASENVASSTGEWASNLTSAMAKPFTSLYDTASSAIGGLFGGLQSLFTYQGYGGQRYYSNPIARQSQPVGGTNGATWTPGV